MAPVKATFWTSNAIFFTGMHVVMLITLFIYPPSRLPLQTHLLSFFLWNVATLGCESWLLVHNMF